jgi:maleate isomerase
MRLVDAIADELSDMADEIDRCVDLLSTADVDVVAYGCTTGSLVAGPRYDEQIESRLSDLGSVPAVATAASIKRAFETLGLESLAIATPYVDDLNERERTFLEAAGYEVTGITGLGIGSNVDIGRQRPETAYREAQSVDTPDADGLFLSCTNYRTFEVIPALEADLGKPVVSSNQATLWDALQSIDVDVSLELGTLFEQ